MLRQKLPRFQTVLREGRRCLALAAAIVIISQGIVLAYQEKLFSGFRIMK
jgi:hypothetical protein